MVTFIVSVVVGAVVVAVVMGILFAGALLLDEANEYGWWKAICNLFILVCFLSIVVAVFVLVAYAIGSSALYIWGLLL